MAYTSAYEICNLALHKIGHSSITSDQFDSPGTNKAALSASILYTPELENMLKSHPWRFAMKRASFDIDNFIDTITGTTAADPVVVTGTDISVANIVEGIGVYIYGTGIDTIDHDVWVATSVSGETFQIYYPDRVTTLNGTSLGTASAGYVRISPLSEYDYAFKLPTDCLSPWRCHESDNWKAEGNYIFTDDSIVYLQYIESVTTVSRFTSDFVMCLATKLAAEFAGEIADKPDMKIKIIEELENIVLPRAEQNNAFEGIPKTEQRRTGLSTWQKAGR